MTASVGRVRLVASDAGGYDAAAGWLRTRGYDVAAAGGGVGVVSGRNRVCTDASFS